MGAAAGDPDVSGKRYEELTPLRHKTDPSPARYFAERHLRSPHLGQRMDAAGREVAAQPTWTPTEQLARANTPRRCAWRRISVPDA